VRVGIDATWARGPGSGTASYTRGLVQALSSHEEHTFMLYFRPGDETQNPLFQLRGPNIGRSVIDGWGQPGRTLVSLTRACSRDHLDLFHSPGYFLPLWSGPKVVTLHDMNMFLQWKKWWAAHRRRSWLSLCVQTPVASRLARRIVTVSETAAGDIERVLRVASDRISVIYQGIDDRFFEPARPELAIQLREQYDLGDYLLYVGALAPLKNLEGIVQAFALARRPGLKLALGGPRFGTHFDQVVVPLIRQLGIEHEVKVLGLVPDDAMPALYAGARAFIYPSFAEGFGLPPIEAMACGTPVIASNRPSFPEVLGDAAILVDPVDIDGLAGAIQLLSTDDAIRQTLVARGRLRASRFHWNVTAAHMLDLYARVAGS
jgi:glycosyltransferase involved in cell wall biosynthesis